MNKYNVSNIKIVDGMLEIDRGNGLMPQTCPYRGAPCGQWCPLFGDVVVDFGAKTDVQRLHLCNGVVIESKWNED